MEIMNLTGQCFERLVLLETKYGFDIPFNSVVVNNTRLTNQIWKLIPMREKEEDWVKQLDTVIIEVVGLNEIFISQPSYLNLLSKLEGLKKEIVNFDFFRKTVFESISLLQGMLK